jgi:hypothetical protein
MHRDGQIDSCHWSSWRIAADVVQVLIVDSCAAKNAEAPPVDPVGGALIAAVHQHA